MDAVDPMTETDDCMSVAAIRQMKEQKNFQNPESQKYDVFKSDATCAANKHGKDWIKSYMLEHTPSQADRFKYGDAVWEKLTGSYIDINALFKQEAFFIANMLKKPLEADKAEQKEEKKERRDLNVFKKEKDRTGLKTIAANADQLIKKDDELHGIFQTSFIDILIQLIMALLSGMNNSGGGGGGGGGGGQGGGNRGQSAQNYQNNPGVFPDTKVQNWGADCVAETLIKDVFILSNKAL
jgi:hypothetical protein